MAIVLCRECEREVSSEARACPHCGYPIKDKQRSNDYRRAEDFDALSDDPFSSFDNNQGNAPLSVTEADSKATNGMILSIVSLFLPIPILDVILAVMGISFGNRAKQMPGLRRTGQATAAVVIGIIALIYNIIFWLTVL